MSGRPRRDEGAALPLVLVLIVIGGLIIVPVLDYAVTVLRANTVMSDKSRQIEAAKAGGRVALADPARLFRECTSTTLATDLGGPQLSTPVSTECTLVAETGAVDALEVPLHAVSIQLGSSVPVDFRDPGQLLAPDPLETDAAWWEPLAVTTPVPSSIWRPELPTFRTAVRESTGFQMPPAYGCTVFFPGRYQSPVVLDGRTYFTSGTYYFEDEVRVVGGADVVVGFGLAEGCADDQEVVFNVLSGPATFDIDGLGATWVFGDDGRLVVDNTVAGYEPDGTAIPNLADEAVSIRFNQRYVAETPDGFVAGGARVSIASVDGDLDGVDGVLDVPGVIRMTPSSVATPTGPVSAVSQGYVPSVHTAEPRPPLPPTGVAAVGLHDSEPAALPPGAALVSWSLPSPQEVRGAPIERYVVTSNPGGRTCTTDGALACVIRGLAPGTPHEFTVTAENAVGVSLPSMPAAATTPPDGSDPATVLGRPAAPSVPVLGDAYRDAVEVRWDAPLLDGGAPVVGYEVRVYEEVQIWKPVPLPAPPSIPDPFPATDLTVELRELTGLGCAVTAFREAPAATSCVVEGLTPLDTSTLVEPLASPPQATRRIGYRFEVVARNVVGESVPSTATDPAVPSFAGPVYVSPPPPDPPPAATYVPLPIVDIRTTGPAPATVSVPGYVSAPQGRVEVRNEGGHDVALLGGLVAGTFGLSPASGVPGSATIGFQNEVVVQRTIRIVSRAANAVSTMIVQVNENGSDYAVNSWAVQ